MGQGRSSSSPQVLLIGLDSAGKSTLLAYLLTGQPPTETIVNPAAEEEEEEEDYDDEETLSAATGRDPEGPTEVCLNIMYSYWHCSTHSYLFTFSERNLEFDMYTEVMSIDNGQTSTFLSFNRTWLAITKRMVHQLLEHSLTFGQYHVKSVCRTAGIKCRPYVSQLPVKELYMVHLMKTIQKTEKEMVYLDRQITKTDLEILLLERQLRDGMVILSVVDLYDRVLLSSNNYNIMENNTCHNDVTCPLWGDPELTQALEPGFERGLAWIASIPQQVAIKLSCNYRGHI
ncbi:hypothetical protein JOB18_013859 [Solea senegalensis]|uniref:Uncharacterized protein n=1 Tax=Solea senegalensis TaxID=28829 RepID=A0AAV6PQ11_SOLSE|nr:hypothetical protein JOB18_013859 [Solea senegalensis]